MTYIAWFIRVVLFLLLLGFAIKNSEPVTLNYYLSYQWRAPLVLVLALFLLIGVVVGLLAASGTIFRQRRSLQALKREARLQLDKARDREIDRGPDQSSP